MAASTKVPKDSVRGGQRVSSKTLQLAHSRADFEALIAQECTDVGIEQYLLQEAAGRQPAKPVQEISRMQ